MTKGIRLPKNVRRDGERYVLDLPSGKTITIGHSIKAARAAVARMKAGETPSVSVPPELEAMIDRSGGAASCWPWTGPRDKDGYGYLGAMRVHRVIGADAAGRELAPGDVVMHACDNPSCCNPLHLSIGTQLLNVEDRVRKGRSAKGEANGRAKLSAHDVAAIRSSTDPVLALAKRYGLHSSTVYDIRAGRLWKTSPDIPTVGIPTPSHSLTEGKAGRRRAQQKSG